jgi:hypothetical protein
VGGTDITKISEVKMHKPGARSRSKSVSYRIVSVGNKTYYSFDKSLAVIANEAKKSGVSVRVEYEVTPYGFKVTSLKSGPFDEPLPLPGVKV